MSSARRKPNGELAEPALRQSPGPAAIATPGKECPPALTPEEIYLLIQETAYLKAEARQFAPGVELQDWLEAEKEILQRLQIS